MKIASIFLTALVTVTGTTLSMAQVYSANAVAGIAVDLQPGFNLIQNPLDARMSGGNVVSNVLDSVPEGTTVYRYTNGPAGSGFIINDYTTLFGWSDPNMSMAPGEGAFVFLPGTTPFTHVFVGEVRQGTLSTPLAAGLNLVGSQVPQTGGITVHLWYTPARGDKIITFNGSGFTSFLFDDEWLPSEPWVGVSQGLWLHVPAAGSWNRTFFVNQ